MCFGGVVRNVDVTVRDPQAAGLERYVGLEHIDPQDLHIRRWGLIADGTSFTRQFSKGQVLFGKRRAYQRKAAVAEFDGICSSDILVFEANGEGLMPELLPFIVQSDGFFEHALGTSAGSLSPRTKWRDLAGYGFSLPPKDEQERAASVLWAAEAVVESYALVHERLGQLMDALIEGFLRGGRRRWPWVPCERLLASGPRNGLSPSPDAAGEVRPTLSIGAVRDGRVVPEGNLKYVTVPTGEAERFVLKPGDILIVRGNGNRDLVGRCGVVGEVPEGCFYPDLLVRVAFDDRKIRPDFARLQWNAYPAHQELLRRAKSTNGIWKINGRDIREHLLLVPPLEEQDAFLRGMPHGTRALTALANQARWARQVKSALLASLLREGPG